MVLRALLCRRRGHASAATPPPQPLTFFRSTCPRPLQLAPSPPDLATTIWRLCRRFALVRTVLVLKLDSPRHPCAGMLQPELNSVADPVAFCLLLPADLYNELQGLPEALRSDFPDLAVDFLATVFRPLAAASPAKHPPQQRCAQQGCVPRSLCVWRRPAGV